jgi:hypothetical protein
MSIPHSDGRSALIWTIYLTPTIRTLFLLFKWDILKQWKIECMVSLKKDL